MIAGWDSSLKLSNCTSCAVVSPSRDGRILQNALVSKGYDIIAGSSDKSPEELKKEIVSSLISEKNVMMTPDGPKGPIRKAKPGAVVLAARSNKDILCLSFKYQKYYSIYSWDRFKIPYPFSKVTISIEMLETSKLSLENTETVNEYIKKLEENLH
ncbi:MAG: hypothetical protein Kapaf2KO_15960 [Candidatus Kapaibacteriales bacterium]